MAYQRKQLQLFRRTTTLLAALALVIAACGGDGDTEADDQAGDSPDESTATEDETEPAEEPEGEGEGETDPDAAPYYEGKTITIWVASNPGGGSDLSMQAFAEAIRKHVPGNPEVELEYKASAGGYEAPNDYFQLGEYDGTTLLNVNLISTTAWMAGGEGVGWDLTQLVPLGVLPPTHMWGVHSDTGITDVEQLADPPTELILGGRSPVATTLLDALVLGMLDLRDNFTEIYGYEGHSDMVLAFEQGEINFLPASSAGWEGSSHLIEDGTVNLLASHGVVGGDGELHPDPAWPDVPVIWDVAEDITGEQPSGEFAEVYKKAVGIFNSGATVALHRDAPQEAIDALRDGIAAAAEDPEWLEKKEELVGGVQQVTGDDLSGIAQTWENMTPEELEFIQNYLNTEYADIIN